MVPSTNSLKHAAACRGEPKFSWGPWCLVMTNRNYLQTDAAEVPGGTRGHRPAVFFVFIGVKDSPGPWTLGPTQQSEDHLSLAPHQAEVHFQLQGRRLHEDQ